MTELHHVGVPHRLIIAFIRPVKRATPGRAELLDRRLRGIRQVRLISTVEQRAVLLKQVLQISRHPWVVLRDHSDGKFTYAFVLTQRQDIALNGARVRNWPTQHTIAKARVGLDLKLRNTTNVVKPLDFGSIYPEPSDVAGNLKHRLSLARRR